MPGFGLCSPSRPVHCVSAFEAQIVLLELRSILSAGFNCVLHVHSATEEVTFAALLHKLEKGTNRKSKKPPGFATKGMSIIARLEVIGGAGSICVERFQDYPQLGRFTLRDQGQTIAIGKVRDKAYGHLRLILTIYRSPSSSRIRPPLNARYKKGKEGRQQHELVLNDVTYTLSQTIRSSFGCMAGLR